METLKKHAEALFRVYYYLLDIVYLDGYDTTHVALRDRKALLKSALRFKDPLRFMTHRHREGEAYLHAACRKGWEGLIASRRSRFMSRVEPQAGSNSSAYNSRNLLSAAIRTLSEVGSVLALCCSAITTTENSATRAR